MTQENKELLLKDLCARLPYGVKVHTPLKPICTIFSKPTINSTIVIDGAGEEQCCIKDIKPYLFPLSSMTEELKNFLKWKLTTPKYDSFDDESLEDLFNNNMQVVNYCYENHLDINGLIEKGLAIDATELNIY